jgi:hypothetical protein
MGGHAGHTVDEPVGAVGLLVTRAEVACFIHLFEEELADLLILCFGGEIGQFSTEALRLKRLQGQFVGLLCGHLMSTIPKRIASFAQGYSRSGVMNEKE